MTQLDLLPFSAHELALCAQREVRWRRKVYPQRVYQRRMSAEKAERELAMMQRIADDYLAKAEMERLADVVGQHPLMAG